MFFRLKKEHSSAKNRLNPLYKQRKFTSSEGLVENYNCNLSLKLQPDHFSPTKGGRHRVHAAEYEEALPEDGQDEEQPVHTFR